MQLIDDDYKLSTTQDPEIKQRWMPLAIAKNFPNATNSAKEFIGSMGRMKYLKPIYIAMNNVDHNQAVDWFNEYKSFYHPYSVRQLAFILNI
jgi:leukotriene-A4 hydrolase